MEEDLILGKLIGSGGYGSVYHGRYNLRRVAVKKFDFTEQDAKLAAAAVKLEIDLLERLRDRYIIQFYATAYHENRLVLIMEFADGGSLKGAIESGRLDVAGNGAWDEKMRISRDIARGLHFIHAQKILHRDLKSANVLLTKRLDVRLADFGLAVVKTQSSSKSTGTGGDESAKGTIRWMAPEIFGVPPRYSTKSDMYALGMVMWEMAARCTLPFKDHYQNNVLIPLIERGNREILPDDTPTDYRHWVERCWEHDRFKRPEAFELFAGDDEDEDDALDASVLSGSNSFGNGTTVDISINFNSMNLGNSATLVQPPSPKVVAPSAASTTKPPSGPSFGPDSNESVKQAKAILDALIKAEGGNLKGVKTLRAIWDHGTGIEKIQPKEFSALLQSAESGHIQSQYCVAQLYHRGRGVDESEPDAARWFQKAADQGHAPSQTMLAWMYDDGSYDFKQDLNQAAKWYRKAANQGYCIAQSCLGLMYASGRGVRQDYARAVEWYHKASEQGYAPAQSNLGYMYEHGRGVEKNNEKAALWYGKAAEQGNLIAQDNLNNILEKMEEEKEE
ncbi:hypothetical protein DFQ26_004638 [Actinomortierella ambigua]|nr:hypothetical protein DFQ26_004638 [Actinomortierella ambigua]